MFDGVEAHAHVPGVAQDAIATVTLAPDALALGARKRMFDIVAASLILAVSLPLLLVVAVLIKCESPGPVLFRQRRTGLGGKPFQVVKLRTMRVLEDGDRIVHATRDDARVTRLGVMLRKSGLDEFPQLINVLRGEMSLVGPRPHALAHDAYYGAALPTYRKRFRVRPGITGLAQVSGHRGEIRNLNCMAARVTADNEYIETWSFTGDLRILLRTVPLLLRDPKAY